MRMTIVSFTALVGFLNMIMAEMDVCEEADDATSDADMEKLARLASALRPTLAQETQAQNDQPMIFNDVPDDLRDVAKGVAENGHDVLGLTGVMIE